MQHARTYSHDWYSAVLAPDAVRGLVVQATASLLYAVPLTSSAFRTMVLGGAEARKLWSVGTPYGGGLSLDTRRIPVGRY